MADSYYKVHRKQYIKDSQMKMRKNIEWKVCVYWESGRKLGIICQLSMLEMRSKSHVCVQHHYGGWEREQWAVVC